MRGFRLLPIVLSLSLLAGTATAAAPPEVLDAGRTGLPRMLRAIPEKDLQSYGFSDRRETSRATLGEPFRLYTLEPEAIIACAQGRTSLLEAQPTNRWLFPVLCDDRPRTTLAVAYLDGAWQAIEIGGLSPVPQMLELARQWPAAQGYRLRYILVLPGGAQLVEVAHESTSDLVPLESTARALGLLGEGEVYDYPLMPASEIATALEPIVRAGRLE
jgi:hypothetical protein